MVAWRASRTISTTFPYSLIQSGHSLIDMAGSVIRLGAQTDHTASALERQIERLCGCTWGDNVMADEENVGPRDEEPADEGTPQPEEAETGPSAEFKMELVDSLPGGRAVIGVEQEGEFRWLASKEHVSEQAVNEFVEQLTKIVAEGWWVQQWAGR